MTRSRMLMKIPEEIDASITHISSPIIYESLYRNSSATPMIPIHSPISRDHSSMTHRDHTIRSFTIPTYFPSHYTAWYMDNPNYHQTIPPNSELVNRFSRYPILPSTISEMSIPSYHQQRLLLNNSVHPSQRRAVTDWKTVTEFCRSQDVKQKHENGATNRSRSDPKVVAPPRRTRERTNFTREQTVALEKEFSKSHYPNITIIQSLSESIDTPENRIQTWFSNRRAKWRRQDRVTVNPIEITTDFIVVDDSLSNQSNHNENEKHARPRLHPKFERKFSKDPMANRPSIEASHDACTDS